MADSEEEFFGESFDDKEDLDRFKIPISEVFRGMGLLSLATLANTMSTKSVKRCRHRIRGKIVFLKLFYNRSALFLDTSQYKFYELPHSHARNS